MCSTSSSSLLLEGANKLSQTPSNNSVQRRSVGLSKNLPRFDYTITALWNILLYCSNGTVVTRMLYLQVSTRITTKTVLYARFARQFSRLIGCPERHVIWQGAGVPALIGARIDLHASSATRVSQLHMHVAETFCPASAGCKNRDRPY